MEREEAVILVVGGQREKKSKALVANLLAEGRHASDYRLVAGGARIFSIESSPEPLVVDTTALVGCKWTEAVQWVSLNSLKQMYDKLISVVCVVTASGTPGGIPESDKGYLSWLYLLALIFHENRQEIMVLVQVAGSDDKAQIATSLIRHGFPEKNISFVTFTTEHLRPTIESALETSGKGEPGEGKTGGVGPFRVRKITSKCKSRDFYGLWGPSPVILFGRTGSGKSTLAQMLTKGRLDSHSKDFAASSGIRGETIKMKAGEGRGWYVVDTPGFGEPDDGEAAVSSEEAEKKLKRYVRLVQGTYCHFLYVRMKDRTDQLEVQLWNFFVSLFSDSISTHFTVVVSNADQTWIKENDGLLRSTYKGCNVCAEFPPKKIDDEEWETELEEVRKVSLYKLEEDLASLKRRRLTCKFGTAAKKTIDAGLDSNDEEMWYTFRDDNWIEKASDKAFYFVCDLIVKNLFVGVRLVSRLTKDEKLLLLPQY